MSEYIKIDDLDDTVLRLNNDGWGITRNEHKLISNVLYEMPLYSFPEEKGEEYRRGWHDAIGKALNEAYDIEVDGERFSVVQEETLLGLGMSAEPFPDREKGEEISTPHFKVKFLKPEDKEYPTPMFLVDNKERYDIIKLDGLDVVPLAQVIDKLTSVEPDVIIRKGKKICPNCGADMR